VIVFWAAIAADIGVKSCILTFHALVIPSSKDIAESYKMSTTSLFRGNLTNGSRLAMP
jgi:hypothetical protein